MLGLFRSSFFYGFQSPLAAITLPCLLASRCAICIRWQARKDDRVRALLSNPCVQTRARCTVLGCTALYNKAIYAKLRIIYLFFFFFFTTCSKPPMYETRRDDNLLPPFFKYEKENWGNEEEGRRMVPDVRYVLIKTICVTRDLRC